MQSETLFQKKLFLFLGKGGVGKTTLAAAWALALSRRGKRVLLAQVNAKERLSHFLGISEVTDQVKEVQKNLHVVNVTPEAAMHEYGVMVLRFESIYKLVFENSMTRSFLRAVPGLDEWVMLGKIWFHSEEKLADGRPRYDHILVDCPATGHGVYFLRAPRAVIEAVPDGPLRDYAFKMRDMLETSSTAPVYVTLPEDMPYNETIELRRLSERDVNLPKGVVVVNGVFSPALPESLRPAYEILQQHVGELPSLAPYLEATEKKRVRSAMQQEYLQKIAATFADLQRLEVPFIASRDFASAEIREIADLLERRWIDRVPGAR